MSNFRDHYIPGVTEALKKWYGGLAESFLIKIGISKGSNVVDFGCGAGNYVLPAGKIVGEEGRVYAIDSKQIVIDEINKKIKQQNLTEQITTIKTTGDFNFPLEDKSIDFTLIFDV
ncbi:MAG: methyltransferase domain-containing protein, partial [Candidatus Thorarchaeota archaeon]